MAWTLRGFCRLATIVMIVLMLTMLVVINALVVTRYAFSYSPSWTEEVTRYAMIWMVMLGAGVLTLFDDHITLTMLVEKLPPRARALQRLLVQAVVCAIALVIAWKGYEFAWGLRSVTAPALQRSMAWAAFSVPIGGSFIAAFAVLRMAIEFATLFGTRPPSLPDQFEFMDNTFKPAEENNATESTVVAGSRERSPA